MLPMALPLAARVAAQEPCETALPGSHSVARDCVGLPSSDSWLPAPLAPHGVSPARAGRRYVAQPSTFVRHKYDGSGRGNLTLSQVLFIVMASNALLERALWVSKTWCSYELSRCIFVSDSPICERDGRALPAGEQGGTCLPTLAVPPHTAPHHCCRKDAFFCDPHRQATLRAQYRFLPALLAAKRSPALRAGAIRWVVVVDDDSWVFPSNLLGLLNRFSHKLPLYLGDFVITPEMSFACGGGGSVLSATLLQRMDVSQCITLLESKCMQSDWMISACVARAKGVFVPNYGCGTCYRHNSFRNGIMRKRLRQGCFFMQSAGPFMRVIRPVHREFPAIIHAYRATAKRTLWNWHANTDSEGRWVDATRSAEGTHGKRANSTTSRHADSEGRWVDATRSAEGTHGKRANSTTSRHAGARGGSTTASAGGGGGEGDEAMPVPEMTDALLERIGSDAADEGRTRADLNERATRLVTVGAQRTRAADNGANGATNTPSAQLRRFDGGGGGAGRGGERPQAILSLDGATRPRNGGTQPSRDGGARSGAGGRGEETGRARKWRDWLDGGAGGLANEARTREKVALGLEQLRRGHVWAGGGVGHAAP